MNLQANTVAGAVDERVTPTGVDDDVPRGAVHCRALCAHRHGGHAGPLRFEHRVPHPPSLRTRFADTHRPSHVRAVPVDDAAEVDHHQLPGLDMTIARAGVRLGTIWTGGHDRVEAHRAGTTFTHRELEPQREVPFGRPVRERRQQLTERIVGNAAGGSDPLHLAGLLHHAQPVDERSRRHQLGVREPFDEAALLAPSHAVVFESESADS